MIHIFSFPSKLQEEAQLAARWRTYTRRNKLLRDLQLVDILCQAACEIYCPVHPSHTDDVKPGYILV